MSHNLSSCNPPKTRKLIISFLITSLDGSTTVISVACKSGFEILATLQTVETEQRHRLDADKFLMFSVGWTWPEFCRDFDPFWSE